MEREILKTFITEIKGINDWIRELNPEQDGEKIAKLQVVADLMEQNYRNYLIKHNLLLNVI